MKSEKKNPQKFNHKKTFFFKDKQDWQTLSQTIQKKGRGDWNEQIWGQT